MSVVEQLPLSADALVALRHVLVQAADDAPTAQEALRATLARACIELRCPAGRVFFPPEAGAVSAHAVWHLGEPESLPAFRRLAEERRPGDLVPEALLAGRPVWTQLVAPDGSGTRATCAVPVLCGDRVVAVLELFSSLSCHPGPALLDALAEAAAEVGLIVQRKPHQDELVRAGRDYRTLFENAHDALLVVDPEVGTILDANQRSLEIYGYARGELLGRPLRLLWPAVELDRLRESAAGRVSNVEVEQVRRDGSRLVVNAALGPIDFRGRRAVWMSNRDVGEAQRAREALRASEERYRLIFEASPQPMWVFDRETLQFLAVNRAAVATYGYAREQFLAMTVSDIRPEDERRMLQEHLARMGSEAGRPTLWRHRKANGEIINVEVASHAIEFAGRAARLVVATDVTARLRAEQKLWHAAFYDALTGLPNRSLFMERLGQALDRARGRTGGGFVVLFLDLDRFKVVNDSMGHRAGDQLLISIARRLDRIRRAGDTVARLGGDEFAMLVDGVEDPHGAGRVADRVQRELSQPFEIEGQEVFTSASIGLALGGQREEQRPEDLLRDADTAMYRAKALGPAHHAVFDTTMHETAVALLQMENDLRRALDRRELFVRYQPIVQLGSQRIMGFEALLRWNHRQRGLIPPTEFIPMAEETGLIAPLGKWVLREACRELLALQRACPRDPPLTVAVNLSGRQILQPDLVEQIGEVLAEVGLDASALRLEITESVLVQNEEAASRCLLRLRALGLKLGIDDFGTGYSSLSYLHRMPIDLLKIDASFVQTMGSDERNRRIVETILALGKNLGMEIIAEGVETGEQADALLRMGCTLMQGHLFAEAVDPGQAVALLVADSAALQSA